MARKFISYKGKLVGSGLTLFSKETNLPPTPPFINTYSLDFDGVDDYINIGNGISFEYTDAFSFSTWIKPLPKSGVKYIYSKYIGGKGILIYLNSSATNNINTLNFNLYNTNSGTIASRKRIVTQDTGFAPVNVWINIVLTYDGSGLASGINYYKNGVLQSFAVTQDNLLNNTIVNTEDAYLSSFNGASSFLLGNQDEFSIFNTELSSADALAIYNSGEPTDLTDLSPIAWLRMGDNGSYKSPQWLLPSNENKDKVSNYSFQFDGVDDRVQLASDFVASGEFTLSFWMKPISAGTPNGKIYPIGTFPGNSNYVKLDQIGVMWLRLGGSNAIFNESVYGGGANNLVLNDWQNIVFIRDSSNVIRCYRNGVDFGYNVAAATNSNTLTLNSFGRIITNSFGYEGGLDEIAFWNSDETANLSTIYNGGEPTTISGAVAHYKMGEDATFSGGVWTVPDAIGSNDGTSNAMTIEDRVGSAPSSSNNALSFNMDLIDRVEDTP